VLKKIVMRGVIDDAEARWIRQWIFLDGKVSPDEKVFIERLRKEARPVGKEFQALYNDSMKG
jgi:hypothetical protein